MLNLENICKPFLCLTSINPLKIIVSLCYSLETWILCLMNVDILNISESLSMPYKLRILYGKIFKHFLRIVNIVCQNILASLEIRIICLTNVDFFLKNDRFTSCLTSMHFLNIFSTLVYALQAHIV